MGEFSCFILSGFRSFLMGKFSSLNFFLLSETPIPGFLRSIFNSLHFELTFLAASSSLSKLPR